MITAKPWGYYETLCRGVSYLVKRIVIYPRHRFSLQKHNGRDEYWNFVSGKGVVIKGDAVKSLVTINTPYSPVETIVIPKGILHRAENTGSSNLVFIEIQVGNCDEDDIVRLADDYGRTP